jgi:hypothetical protein
MTLPGLALPGFERADPIPVESIERFSSLVPAEFVELWQQGSGTFADGFLRVVDPAPLEPILQQGVVLSDGAVPVFVTAFGDIVYWKETSLAAALFRHGVIEGVTGRPELLPRFFADQGFFDVVLHAQLWPEAKAVHGVPDLDECLGFAPMLVLGGPERVDHLKRVKLLEHLDLLTQATGPLA